MKLLEQTMNLETINLKKQFVLNHFVIIFIFLALTLLFTYPAMFTPNEIPGEGPRDLLAYVWSMW